MDNKLLLVKSITLLFRESQLVIREENSSELVRTVLESVQVADVSIGINSERDIILALKSTALEMCNDPADYSYDKQVLLQRLRINCSHDDKLYESFVQGIDQDIQESQLKRSIVNLRKSINNHFREQKITETLNKAAYQFKHQRDKVKDVNTFIAELSAQLEALQISTTIKDPAVINDVDLGDETETTTVFTEIQKTSNGDGIMRTGWHALNRMTQGGFRRGETVILGALQHKYKSGFSLSIFEQVARYNKPYMLDPTKKPLLLRISFEDNLSLNLQFMYQKLKEEEGIDYESAGTADVKEMATYIRERLQVNGYHIKMMRVDPTLWTYKSICNKVIELEAQGYEIHMLMLDYLAMVPTTGCSVGGPIGSDKRDMFRRMRNFCSPKGITLITPHQLSTEAKQLLRDGRQDFVKDIAEKGYWDGSKTLDQEVDLELYIHIEKLNRESYLTVQRGKHRIPTIIPDDHKYFVLKFPKRSAIPNDIEGPDSSLRKVGGKPGMSEDGDDALFDFLPPAQ